MKKKYLLALTILTTGILLTGCTGSSGAKTSKVNETSTQSEADHGTETKAAKAETSDGTGSTETGTSDGTGTEHAGADNAGAGITETQAKEKAIADSGVSEDDITGIRIKKDWDNGREVYDVEFYAGNQEYDYEIDLLTGEILEWSKDVLGD